MFFKGTSTKAGPARSITAGKRFIILHEQFTVKSLVDCLLIEAGTLVMVLYGTLKYREMTVCSGMIQQLGRGF